MSLRYLFHSTIFAFFVMLSTPLHAVVDDAYSKALELASEPHKQGFRIREDYWKGHMKSGEKIALKSQLFKGNDYWFWLGAEIDGVDLAMDVYNAKGETQTVTRSAVACAQGILFSPPKTGLYIVIFTITMKKGEGEFGWALAQGYR